VGEKEQLGKGRGEAGMVREMARGDSRQNTVSSFASSFSDEDHL